MEKRALALIDKNSSITMLYTDKEYSKNDSFNGWKILELYEIPVDPEFKYDIPWYQTDRSRFGSVTIDKSMIGFKPVSLCSWFSGFNKLTQISGLENINTSACVNMSELFMGCTSLTELKAVSGWDTSGVTDMSYMFSECSSLTSLDLSGWNVSRVSGSRELGFPMGGMKNMFSECAGLESLNISGWNPSSALIMCGMFKGCESLKSLDLSGWTEFKVTDIGSMFCGCSGLKKIAVSENCNLSDLPADESVFYECLSLVGGNKTRYSWNRTDSSFACIDTPEHPGFFTLKTRPAASAKAVKRKK